MRTGREVAVFIRRGDEMLILHRSVERYWHIVAGVVEDGETCAEAARRELDEEVGLDSPHLHDLGLTLRYPLPNDQRWEYPAGVDECVIENYAVAAPAGWEPTLNEEHDVHRWTSLHDAMRAFHWPEARDAAPRAWELTGEG